MVRFPFLRWTPLAILCLSGIVAAQDQPGGPPQVEETGPSRIEIRSGGAVRKQGGEPLILLFVESRTDQPVWVRVEVRAPEPAQGCIVSRMLPARGKGEFVCPQKQLVADRDYPVAIEAFGDESMTERLESKTTTMRFRAQDVAALDRQPGAPAQSVTLRDVWFRTDEAQVLIAYKEEGTLEVAADRLTFTHAGGKLEIPVVAIQRMVPRRRFALFDVNEWAVIEYRLSGKDLVAAFKPAAFRGRTRHDDIVNAIRNVLPR